MNLAIFFEGTGQGVPGRFTNVTRLHDACRSGPSQKLHLVPGLGTRFGALAAGKIAGLDWQAAFADARRWFEANYRTVPECGIGTTVYLFGFSRGALLARPASLRGLRLKPGVRLVQKFDPCTVVLHDSRHLISNLWGILGSTPRVLDKIPLHPLCRTVSLSRK